MYARMTVETRGHIYCVPLLLSASFIETELHSGPGARDWHITSGLSALLLGPPQLWDQRHMYAPLICGSWDLISGSRAYMSSLQPEPSLQTPTHSSKDSLKSRQI